MASLFAKEVMLILLCVFFCIVAFYEVRFSIIELFSVFSGYLHHECLSLIPQSSPFATSLSALVCGKNFDSLQESSLYTATGLIHLFVVSGSHLLILYKIINVLTCKKIPLFTLLLLWIYCAICQFNPPVVRSFIFLSLYFVLKHFHRKWAADYVLMLAGLLTLGLQPQWISSLSLQMSWLAALVLLLYQENLKDYPFLIRQILFYFTFLFCFLGLGFPAFSITVLGVIMTPLLEYILFPLALLTTLFHSLEPIFTIFMEGLNTFLSHLNYSTTPSHLNLTEVKSLNWVVIFCCHYFLFFKKAKT